MKPQSEAYLEKSHEMLEDARRTLAAALPGHAARMAYFVAFHAAQALIIERQSRAAKTHRGVNAQFARIARDEGLARDLPAFLTSSYHYKESVDYDTGPERIVRHEDAACAISEAEQFLLTIAAFLGQRE